MVNALPYEIFLLITENLPMDRDVSLKADVNYHRCIYNGEAKPLTGGAKEGYVGITRLLLEHGAEVDLCNPDGGPCEPPSTLAAAEDKYGLLCYPKEIQNYRSSDDESLDESLYLDNIFDVRVTEKLKDNRDYKAAVRLLGANSKNTKKASLSRVSPLMVAARCGNL
ncbi:hypothetical protein PEX1_039880 [Penicillium expansum]|nr:hypothetical protein PEX1_039880 [Penicillium expansum]